VCCLLERWLTSVVVSAAARRLVDAAMSRTVEIRTFYDRVMARLVDRYPVRRSLRGSVR
jgi:hypothetical protein